MQILFADDTLDTRQLFALVFCLEGHTMCLAEDGAEAIQMVQEHHFDVIIIDALMPGIDGLTAIQRIRQLPNGQHIPIILITAYDCTEQTAREAGANLLLHKPILVRDLLAKVKRLHAEATGQPVQTSRHTFDGAQGVS